MLIKLFVSGLSLLKTIVRTAAVVLSYLIQHALAEILFWLATLGLGYLLVSFGISNNIALSVAVFLALGLLFATVFMLHRLNRDRGSTKKGKGGIRLASSIARFLANSSSAQWDEYQDWLHDILLARQQLLDEKCPLWKVRLITYRRLSMFCLVVGVGKIKQVALKIRRSR